MLIQYLVQTVTLNRFEQDLRHSSLLGLNLDLLALKSGYRDHRARLWRLISVLNVSESFWRLRVKLLNEINLLANLKAINLRHLNIGQHDLVSGFATPRRQLHSEEPDSFPAREARSELDVLGLKQSL